MSDAIAGLLPVKANFENVISHTENLACHRFECDFHSARTPLAHNSSKG
jgi:hypothetical protein